MLRMLTEAKSVKPPMPRQQERYIPLNRKEGSNCSWEETLTQKEIARGNKLVEHSRKVTAW